MDHTSYPVLHDLTQTYENYLSGRNYLGNVQQGIIMLSDRTIEMFSLEALEGEWALTREISESEEIVSFSLLKLREGISTLKADFNIAMGGVLVNFEMMREGFREALEESLNNLAKITKNDTGNPFKEALESYRSAFQALHGTELLKTAFRQLQAATAQYRQNPLAQLHLGHIFHYQKQHPDFKRALECYLQCFAVGVNHPKQHPVAAQGAFYGGWLTAAVFGDIQTGLELTGKALELDPVLCEAHYHAAKMQSALGEGKESVARLKKLLVDVDRTYCLKIEKDADFKILKDQIRRLFYEVTEIAISEVKELMDQHRESSSEVLKMHVQDKVDYAQTLFNTNDSAQHAQAIMLLEETKNKIKAECGQAETEDVDYEEFRQREQAQRVEEEERRRRAEEDARMQAELKSRMEEEMKARIAAQKVRQRRRDAARAIVSNFILILAVLTLVSFVVFGLNTVGIVLLALTNIAIFLRVFL